MLFWPKSSGCCCDGGSEPDPCTDTFWDVQFNGCFGHAYTGGGYCELRRYSDGVLLATATIVAGYASGTVTLSPAPTGGPSTWEVKVYAYPDELSLYSGLGSFTPANMICGSAHGFADPAGVALTAPLSFTIRPADDYHCCPDEQRAIPQTVFLTDAAGTTTLVNTIGVGYVGTGATLYVPAGRNTFGGCSSIRADITIGITYRWNCETGALVRNVTSCGNFISPTVESLRDKDDFDDLTYAITEDLPSQAPASLSHFPVSATYASYTKRGAVFGTTSIVE